MPPSSTNYAECQKHVSSRQTNTRHKRLIKKGENRVVEGEFQCGDNKTNCQVSEFTVTHLGIPVLICETKQGYRTGEAAQTRFNRSKHTHTHNQHNRMLCMSVYVCVCEGERERERETPLRNNTVAD